MSLAQKKSLGSKEGGTSNQTSCDWLLRRQDDRLEGADRMVT